MESQQAQGTKEKNTRTTQTEDGKQGSNTNTLRSTHVNHTSQDPYTIQEVRLMVPSPSTTRRGASPSMIGERKVGGDPIRRSSLSPAGDGRIERGSLRRSNPHGGVGAKLS